jgi:TrpR-related protein YerC/YecD
MKDHRILNPTQETAAEEELFRAILRLESLAECRAFFQDLCTPAELQALKDRWAVAELLADGLTYREIHNQTGVSITTIGRVARFLANGAGGYNKVLERMKNTDQ